jgi:hypothetical protein
MSASVEKESLLHFLRSFTAINDKRTRVHKKKRQVFFGKTSLLVCLLLLLFSSVKLQWECVTSRKCKTLKEWAGKERRRRGGNSFLCLKRAATTTTIPQRYTFTLFYYTSYHLAQPQLEAVLRRASARTHTSWQSCTPVESSPREIRLVLAIRHVVWRHTRQFYGFSLLQWVDDEKRRVDFVRENGVGSFSFFFPSSSLSF